VSRKAIAWIVVIAAVAAVLVIAALMADRRGAGQSATGGPGGASTATVGATSTPPPTSGKQVGGPNASGNAASTAPTRTPVPTVAKPVAPGARLTTITVAPPRTLAYVDPARATAESTYAVTFSIFGVGPTRFPNVTRVVLISASKPGANARKAYDFKGRNVLAIMDRTDAAVAAKGGRYRAVLVLRPTEGMLAPVLTDVRRD
jgi:hypothetical protein